MEEKDKDDKVVVLELAEKRSTETTKADEADTTEKKGNPVEGLMYILLSQVLYA